MKWASFEESSPWIWQKRIRCVHMSVSRRPFFESFYGGTWWHHRSVHRLARERSIVACKITAARRVSNEQCSSVSFAKQQLNTNYNLKHNYVAQFKLPRFPSNRSGRSLRLEGNSFDLVASSLPFCWPVFLLAILSGKGVTGFDSSTLFGKFSTQSSGSGVSNLESLYF